MATKEELKAAVKEVLEEKQKETTGDICPTCHNPWDIRHQLGKKEGELEKATTEIGRLGAEASRTRTEADTRVKEAGEALQSILSHIENPESCSDPEHCGISKKLKDFRRKTITPKEVGDWIREAKKKESK